MNLNDYAVTIQIPSSKRVYHDGIHDGLYNFYASLDNDAQKFFIEKELKNWAFYEKQYEQTPSCPKKRLHLHGYIHLEPELMQKFVYDVIDKFGTPKYSNSKLLKIVPIFNKQGWENYIRKQLSIDGEFPFNFKKSDYPPSP